MEIRLTQEQLALCEQVRRFAEREVLPHERTAETDPNYGRHLLKRLGQGRLLGLCLPEEYGGVGLSHLDAALCVEEMARHSIDAAAFMAASSVGQAHYILSFGTEAQRRKYLPSICAGEYSIAIGITEPGAGTASTALTTRAVLRDGRFVLNGRKHYVSNVPNAGLFIVYARIGSRPGAKGICAILVERNTAGFSVERLSENMAGHFQADLLFDDCEVPESQLLLGEGAFADLTRCYNLERCGGTALVLGVALGAFDRALAYVQTRQQFGRELVEFQAVQLKIANMAMQLQAARLMLVNALSESAGEFPSPLNASMCKVFGNEVSKFVADEALQLFGGAGYLKESGIERRYRFVRGFSIAGGPLDIHRTMIAGWLTDRHFSQWAPQRETIA
jgi:alkylation response protein AidB-like acyl-CoA dehydrogenase